MRQKIWIHARTYIYRRFMTDLRLIYKQRPIILTLMNGLGSRKISAQFPRMRGTSRLNSIDQSSNWPRISRIGLYCGNIYVMKDKKINKSKIKLIDDESGEKEEKKRGRPTIFTPELRAKLIKLFEKHFFVAIVAVEAGIYRRRIYEWKNEDEDFRNEITHAQGKWIAQQMELLNEYAKDKRTKDWRAPKHLLSIADAEFNEKKYLRETPRKRESTKINIIIE